jgi:ADP-ribosylglycohydrolase
MLTLLLNTLSRVPENSVIEAQIALGPVAAGRDLITDSFRRADYLKRLTETKRLSDLKLGERDGRSYVLKTLACAMWALRQLVKTAPSKRDAGFFKATLVSLAAQGGDASANCAVAGAVLGAAIGHARLPQEWLKALPNHEWLAKEVATFLAAAAPSWEMPGAMQQ